MDKMLKVIFLTNGVIMKNNKNTIENRVLKRIAVLFLCSAIIVEVQAMKRGRGDAFSSQEEDSATKLLKAYLGNRVRPDFPKDFADDKRAALTCFICTEVIRSESDVKLPSDAPCVLPCSHRFHKDCIDQWFVASGGRRCPHEACEKMTEEKATKEAVFIALVKKKIENECRENIRNQLFLKAAEKGYLEALKILIGLVDIDCADRMAATGLFRAAQNGHIACVRVLIHAGAGINIPDQENLAPLDSAAINGNRDCVMLLLREGAEYVVSTLLAFPGAQALVEACIQEVQREVINETRAIPALCVFPPGLLSLIAAYACSTTGEESTDSEQESLVQNDE